MSTNANLKEIHREGVLQLREQQWGYSRIARELGISTTTVRRILDPDSELRWLKQSRDAKRRRTGVCHGCGATTRYNGHDVAVSDWCPACRTRQNTKWTHEAVLNAIRLWADEHDGQPPGAMDWNPSLAVQNGAYGRARTFEADTRWPWVNTVRQRFGSWNEAIRQAGFTPRRVGERGLGRRFG